MSALKTNIQKLWKAPADARLARLRLAVAASSATKVVRLATQAIIIGISVRYLGAENYGLWLTVVAALGWLSWGQAGLAPGLVNAIATAEGTGSKADQGVYFTTALAVVSTGALIVLIAGSSMIAFSEPNFVGLAGTASAGVLGDGTWLRFAQISLALAMLRFPLALVESAYLGLQNLHVLRLWEIAGQIFSVAIVAGLAFAEAPIPLFLLFSGLAAEAGAIAAGLHLVGRHPHLRPSRGKFDLGRCRGMLNLSAGYFLLQVAGYLVLQAGTLILAAYHGPGAVPAFALVWQLYQMASGVWMMFVAGLWGALAEARARGEWQWIARIARQIVLGSMALSIAFSIGLAIGGHWVVDFWSGGRVSTDRSFLLVMALTCSVFAWAVIHGQIMSALSLVWSQVAAALANGVLVVGVGFLLIPSLGTTGLALTLLIACALSTAWAYPVLLRHQTLSVSNVAT